MSCSYTRCWFFRGRCSLKQTLTSVKVKKKHKSLIGRKRKRASAVACGGFGWFGHSHNQPRCRFRKDVNENLYLFFSLLHVYPRKCCSFFFFFLFASTSSDTHVEWCLFTSFPECSAHITSFFPSVLSRDPQERLFFQVSEARDHFFASLQFVFTSPKQNRFSLRTSV